MEGLTGLLTLVGTSASIAVALFVALHIWGQRRRLRRELDANGSCAVCGTPYREALYEVVGAITSRDRERLDHFQRRYAAFTVHCQECDGISAVTRDGQAMKGWLIDRR